MTSVHKRRYAESARRPSTSGLVNVNKKERRCAATAVGREGRREGGRGRHDTAGAAQRVPQRQADRGGAGDLPRRQRHDVGLPERDPALQAGEREAPQAARRGRGAAAAAAVSR